jgi:uncharacterized membrane protein
MQEQSFLMKYFALLVFLILIWMIMSEFVLADRKSEGLTSVWQKLRDLGSRFHLAVGVVAILILIYFVVRFVLAALESQ